MKKVVLCPMGLNGYDTDIQFDDFSEALAYADDKYIHDFAILDALSLEYYGAIELY